MNREVFYPHYEKLLAQEYHFWRETETKPVWQWIQEERLTVCPAFKGGYYDDCKIRLMVVGRAVNGWEIPKATECTSLEKARAAVVGQEFSFDDIVNEEGIEQKDGSRYYYSRSRFWKLIRNILEECGEGENFHKKIVWSNLYKVAPRVTGNPAWSLVKPQMETYIDLLLDEIRAYKPTHILFVTGMDYINPWENRACFGKILGVGENDKFDGENYKVGFVEEAKVVVCGRPELKSDENIRKMAKDILEKFGIDHVEK